MSDNIYGPGDDDYGRDPKFGPFHLPKEVIMYPVPMSECRPYNEVGARFIEWVAARAYKDIRGKYRVYQMNIKHTLSSLDELYTWWENNIENK